ncbi:hypothetical protein Pyn_40926 [Prunus yedoensis var. nudiflora]|uniref:Uncharacterized protein n=1 Tax=Prunus yedoensis var. nudiflora TaxID=2094558 RepID=A0A314URZ2_PRUYE|nr:hypothetical protein Pyn_40926 [Prunus yedoensis var. nudiflora]
MAMTDDLQNGPPLSPAKVHGEGDTSPLLSLVKLTKSGLLLFTFPKSTSPDEAYNTGDYINAVVCRQKAENISSVLYPDNRLFQDFYELWPQKFQCKTNGVTQSFN